MLGSTFRITESAFPQNKSSESVVSVKRVKKMDEQEFRRLLDLFPLVRPRDYQIELDPSRQSTSLSRDKDSWENRDKIEVQNHGTEVHDAFWRKLRIEAEKKVGAEEAKRFCLAFQQVHKKLIHEGLSLDAARNFINRSKNC